MPRIRCHYLDCVFLDDGACGAAKVEVDPDTGCMTYKRAGNLLSDDSWGDEDMADEGWSDFGFEEEDGDDAWLDEEDL